MGTIRVNPGSVSETNSWTLNGGATSVVDVLSANSVGNVGISFPPTHSVYILDCEQVSTVLIDGTPVNYNDLPAGFAIATLVLHATGVNTTQISNCNITYNGSTIFNINSNVTFPLSISISLSGITVLDLYDAHWVFNVTPTSSDPTDADCRLTGFYLSGTYQILDYQFKLDNTSQPVQQGTKVTVTSDLNDPTHLQLNQFSEVDVVLADSTVIPIVVFDTAQEDLLVFELPNFGSSPIANVQVINIVATGNGVQFSGYITLGKLETIYFLNAVGIYFLDPTATCDTLYDNNNGGIIQVAIPNPFFKTGFIGS